MAGDLYVFIDESGNFDFSTGGSKYFVLNAIVTDDAVQGAHRLLDWRHHVLTCGPEILKSKRVRDYTHFHCTDDSQYVRGGVFKVVAALAFEAHAVIPQKNKTNPSIQTPHDLYQRAFGGLVKGVVRRKGVDARMHIFAAQLDVKPKRSAFLSALKGALAGEKGLRYQLHFHPTQSHHMLQVSDYVCWAISRKWEIGDKRSYALIRAKIVNEFDYFRVGSTLYY